MRSLNAIEQTLCLRVSSSASSRSQDLKKAVVSDDNLKQFSHYEDFPLVEEIVKKPMKKVNHVQTIPRGLAAHSKGLQAIQQFQSSCH